MQNSNPEVVPTYTQVPVGIDATGMRSEFDSLGSVDVPADRYWGAQTQRSLLHFPSATTTCRSRCTAPTVR